MLFLAIVLIIANVAIAKGQNVQRNQSGDFSSLTLSKTTAAHDSTTTFTYTDSKEKVEPVYKGKRGGFYITRTSKPSARNNNTGKFYRKYLKD